MTPEEIVKRLRRWTSSAGDLDAAADIIEQQAKEIEYLKTVKEAIDKDWSRQAKALEKAENALIDAQDMFSPNCEAVTAALAAIRALKGESDDG
jgi:hypothetical protein